MDKSYRNILINSTIVFISAFIITTFIHELGHFISYAIFGANPTLYHNFVQTHDQTLSLYVRIISALAGPVISLFQGIIFGIIVSTERKNTVSHLFFLWISLLGYVNFFGYLVMTPLSTVGDTGKVAELLNISYAIRISIAVIGFAVLIWLILKIGKNFSNFIPVGLDTKRRTKYVYNIMFFPIMIGSLINMIFAFPVVAILSIIYPLTSSYVIMSSFDSILKNTNPQPSLPEFETRIMKSAVLLFMGSIILNRVLTIGVG